MQTFKIAIVVVFLVSFFSSQGWSAPPTANQDLRVLSKEELEKQIAENKREQEALEQQMREIVKDIAKDDPRKKLCEEGDSEACSTFGMILYHQLREIKEARKYYKKACNNNFMFGCFSLGYWEEKHGKKGDALSLYKRSCEGGYFAACFNAGTLAMKIGRSDEAITNLEIACKNDFLDGCHNLGMTLDSIGRKAEARATLKRACSSGYELACVSLKSL